MSADSTMENDIRQQSSSEAFATLSGDGGHLTVCKLRAWSFSQWVRKYVSDLILSNQLSRRRAPRVDKAIDILVAKAKTSDDGELSFAEFNAFVKLVKDPSDEHPFQAELTWTLFDTSREGYLIFHHLAPIRKMLSMLGLTCDNDTFEEFQNAADDLRISIDQYYSWFAALSEKRPQLLKIDRDPHDQFVRDTFLEISRGEEYLSPKQIKSRLVSGLIRNYLTVMTHQGILSPTQVPKTDRAMRILLAKAEVADNQRLSFQEVESVTKAMRHLSPKHPLEAELTWHLFDTSQQGFIPVGHMVSVRAMLSKLDLACDNSSFEELLRTADDDRISSDQYYEWFSKLIDQRAQSRKPVVNSATDEDPHYQWSREAFASLTSESGGRLTLSVINSRMLMWIRMYVTDMTVRGVLPGACVPGTQRTANILIAKAEVSDYGDLSFEEFYAFTRAMKDLSPGRRLEAELTWRLVDTDGRGFLTFEQLVIVRKMLSRLRLTCDNEYFVQLLETADDYRISLDNYLQWFDKDVGKRPTPRKKAPLPKMTTGYRERSSDSEKQSRSSTVKAMGMTFSHPASSADQFLRSAEIAGMSSFTSEFSKQSSSPRTPTWGRLPTMRQEKNMAFTTSLRSGDQLARSRELAKMRMTAPAYSPLKEGSWINLPLSLSETVREPTPRHTSARKWPGLGTPPSFRPQELEDWPI